MEQLEEAPPQIVVAALIDDYRVVINRGANEGIKIGNRFLIYGIGGEVTDPITKQSLGRLEIVRGTGRVVHLQEHMATVESDQLTKPIPTTKRIRRDGMAMFGTEIVETYQDEPRQIPLQGAQVGDRVRPV